MKKRILCITLFMALGFVFSSCKSNTTFEYQEPSYEISPPPTLTIPEVYPFDWKESLGEGMHSITYSARLQYNNHVGDSWGYGISYNDEYIESGSMIQCQSTVTVSAYVIERDSYNDYGSADIQFDSLDVGEEQTKEAVVIVRENRGKYSGNAAKWVFKITVERIT